MIQILFFWGLPILAICWAVGLPSLWRGQPKLSLWASGLGILLGAFVAIMAMAGPRYSQFWMGGLGSGDGMGLIGMFVFGGVAAGFALVGFFITAVVAASRKSTLNKGTDA